MPYAHRFFMPGNSFWYWFDYSSIHFVSVSSDHNYTRGSEQYTWLGTHHHPLPPSSVVSFSSSLAFLTSPRSLRVAHVSAFFMIGADAHLTEFNRARNGWMRTHRRGRKAPESAEGPPADDEAEKEW